MESYSLDLRKRILEDGDAGVGTREVALKYRVSESWVRAAEATTTRVGRDCSSSFAQQASSALAAVHGPLAGIGRPTARCNIAGVA